MKKFLVCITLLFTTISCSSDLDNQVENANSYEFEKSEFPANPLNPMDKIGKGFYESLKLYEKDKKSTNSTADLTDQLRFLSKSIPGKHNLTGKGLITFTDEIVESIMADPDNALILIVESSNLSTSSKNNLINFLQDLIYQRNMDFSVLYTFVVSYEADTLNDSSLIQLEKDTLLTVAAISRYSLYSAEERKDRDWETSVGNKPSHVSINKDEIASARVIAMLHVLLKF